MSLATPLTDEAETVAKIDAEIDKILENDGGKTLDTLETLRQKYLLRLYFGFAAVAAIGLFFIVLCIRWGNMGHDASRLFNLLFMVWFFMGLASLLPLQQYKSKARQLLMPPLVKLFGDLSWSSTAPLTGRFWDDLNDCGLIGEYDSSDVSDLVTGTIKGIPITLMEMSLTCGAGKSRAVIFAGAAVHIHLQKPSPTRLLIKPQHIERDLFCSPDIPSIGIPSPEFNRAFRAFGDDQVLGRTLLTPDVVEQLTMLNALFDDGQLGVALRDESLFLMAYGDGELSPESIFTNAHDLDNVYEAGRRLYLLSTFIETITRDWRLDTETPYQPAP